MVKDYLKTLKNKGEFTCAELSSLSGIPEATIRKILSGETPDPRFETVSKLVNAMGGSMDDILGRKKGEEIETNAVLTIKETYDARIAEMKEYITLLRKDKHILAVTVGVLMGIIALLLVADIVVGSTGWVRF